MASYQALKHRFADMKMWLEACRATTSAAVAAISDRSPDAGLSASIAKSYVGEMSTEIIQACVQMHGGIGVTWEHDLHVYLRRAALYRSMFGTPGRTQPAGVPVAGGGAAGAEVRLMTETYRAGAVAEAESIDEFRARARAWLAENMPPIDPAHPPAAHRDEERCWLRARELQKRLYEGGFAGICFPREYGGLGLDYEYQKAFNDESLSYEMPLILNTPTFTICCATLLDTASEEQKRQHIGAALRGDEILVQLLSEPSGGSDLAGVLTRAERDGDHWVLNGAKTWSTSAFGADYGLCLARTNWDVPKHDGLTMFLVPIKHPGITLRRITQLNGSTEFCEEFLDNVDVGDDAVVGEVNDGWSVASRQLYHERRAVGMGSEFASGSGSEGGRSTPVNYMRLAAKTGQADNERVRQIAGRALVHRAVSDQLGAHVFRSVNDGTLPPAAGTLLRLFHAETVTLEMDAGLAITGTAGVVGADGEGLETGLRYLVPTNGLYRRRHQRVGPQRHRRAGVEFPSRIRRRPRRAVQSGQAREGRALNRPRQPVRQQFGKPRRIFRRVAFGEKCCTIEQFGSFAIRRIVAAVFVGLLQAGDQRVVRVEFQRPLADRDILPGGPVDAGQLTE